MATSGHFCIRPLRRQVSAAREEMPHPGDALQLMVAEVLEVNAEPASRSFTVLEASTSQAPARLAIRARDGKPGADDGIRTRDPHLGKVARPGCLTCAFASNCTGTRTFAFALNAVDPRRCAVVHGTPTGPQMPVVRSRLKHCFIRGSSKRSGLVLLLLDDG